MERGYNRNRINIEIKSALTSTVDFEVKIEAQFTQAQAIIFSMYFYMW